MQKEQAQKIAEDLFKHYPDAESFHITQDGQAFFTQNDATNHVKNIGGEIIEVKRAGEADEAPATEADEKKAELDKAIKALEKEQTKISNKLSTLKDQSKIDDAHLKLQEINKELEAKRAELAALETE